MTNSLATGHRSPGSMADARCDDLHPIRTSRATFDALICAGTFRYRHRSYRGFSIGVAGWTHVAALRLTRERTAMR